MFRDCLYFFVIVASLFSCLAESRERMSLSRREKEMECVQIQRKLEKKRRIEQFVKNPQTCPKPTFAPEKIVLLPEIAEKRVAGLFPEGSPFPLIEPKLSEDYVLCLKHPHDTLEEGIFWAKREAPHAPFFKLSWKPNLRQDVQEHFENESSLVARLKAEGLTDIHIQKMQWGSYPVIAISAVGKSFEEVRRAWVGLNRPDKRIMQVEFIVPENGGSFVEHELMCWEPFLHQTRGL